MQTIGIIASLPEELAVLEQGMHISGQREAAGLRFMEGTIGPKQVVATICGVGKVSGARTAQMLIDLFHPDALIHTGVAGSLCEEAAHLSLVVSTSLTYHDADMQWLKTCPPYTDLFPADETLRSALMQAALSCGPAHAGLMVTGDRFISDPDIKQDISRRTQGMCVDMETAATAHVALVNGVPYCAVKCISDMADDSAGGTFDDFVAIAADKAAGTTLRAIAAL